MASGTKGKVKDALGIISNFISTFLVALVVMVAAILVAARCFHFTLLNVESGSMQPYLDMNTLIAVREVDFDEIETGDVITFVMNENLMFVTHRVVYIDRENQTFITKGDANNTNDAGEVQYESVVGKVVFKLPKLGAVVEKISAGENRRYVIAAVAVLAALVLISDFAGKYRLSKKQKAAAQEAGNQICAKAPPGKGETEPGGK